MKDGHGGPINQLAAARANDADLAALKVEPEVPKVRKSKDGNVREELGVPQPGEREPRNGRRRPKGGLKLGPKRLEEGLKHGTRPYATSIPCAQWPDSPPKRALKRGRQMERGGSLPGP